MDLFMSRQDLEHVVRAEFSAQFGGEPSTVARSPARVELLGNHTDHNDGLVLSAAIDRETCVAIRPTPVADRRARVRSLSYSRIEEYTVGRETAARVPGSWLTYVQGVTWALAQTQAPALSGFAMLIGGDIPLGAGLSSSASLQAAVAIAIGGSGLIADDPLRMNLAKLLRRAENEFVGVSAGLLDQVSTLFGRADHAITLDCRSLAWERVPIGNPAPAIVVCDSMTSRKLADGMYNIRRAECESVVTTIRRRYPSEKIDSLRDVTPEMLNDSWMHLDAIARLRARHVLTENDRVRQGAEALKRGDLARFGQLMSASHASSRADFANSSPALDALIEAAESSPGFLGGKLSGAGWAGCTVNLVEADKAEAFAQRLAHRYEQATQLRPIVHVCKAADGGMIVA